MVENNESTHDSSEVTNRKMTVKSLIDLLNGGNAHVDFENALKDIPAKFRDATPKGLPYSIWQLLEHIRITQWDILEFSRDKNHKSPAWPEGYWPKNTAPDDATWKESLAHIKKDRKEFMNLLTHPGVDLYTPFPYGDGQNLIREALLIADHTSYHLGEIIIIRRILGIW